MKILINNCYGGFGFSENALNLIANNNPTLFEEFIEKGIYDTSRNEWYDMYLDERYWRTNEILISELESLIEMGISINDSCSCVEILEIPDNATDWMMSEYDGIETVYYVVDGKIKTAC